MTFNGCPHLEALKSEKGTKSYYILHACFISCKSADDRRRKVKISTTQPYKFKNKSALTPAFNDLMSPK